MDIFTMVIAIMVVVIWLSSLMITSSYLSTRIKKKQNRAVSQKVHHRRISVIAKIDGSKKCLICMGVIKKDLPSIDCSCGSHFHNSCGSRVGICPGCGKQIETLSADTPAAPEHEFRPIRIMPLSKEDRLYLLEDKFLLGEMDQDTYLKLKEQVLNSMPEPVFCAACGNRFYPGEKCPCTETPRCPECNNEMSEKDEFCRSCGIIISEDFAEELYQCSSCGMIVAASQRICSCGALLLDPGDAVCPECGHPVSPTEKSCPKCGRIRIIELLECPSCGKEIGPSDFECECGAIFEDMIERIVCPECGSEVGLEERYCKGCGIQFERDAYSSVHNSL